MTTVPGIVPPGPLGVGRQAVSPQKDSVGRERRNHSRPTDSRQHSNAQKLTCSWVGAVLRFFCLFLFFFLSFMLHVEVSVP